MPDDPRHPYFYHVYSDTLPPKDAYLLYSKKNRVLFTVNLEQTKLKGYKMRQFYYGWNNYTEFERHWIQKVIDELRTNHGINMSLKKGLGPRAEDGVVIENIKEVTSGRDPYLTNAEILKFIITREFNLQKIIPDLLYHL